MQILLKRLKSYRNFTRQRIFFSQKSGMKENTFFCFWKKFFSSLIHFPTNGLKYTDLIHRINQFVKITVSNLIPLTHPYRNTAGGNEGMLNSWKSRNLYNRIKKCYKFEQLRSKRSLTEKQNNWTNRNNTTITQTTTHTYTLL